MATSAQHESLKERSGDRGNGYYGGNGNFGGGSDDAFPVEPRRLGLWLFLISVAMLFSGLASAFVVHRLGPAWEAMAFPGILWMNTLVLLLSGVTLELGRASAKNGNELKYKVFLAATLVLGVWFLVGQVVAWSQLVESGVYSSGNIHGSFFYVLTGVHGVHLVSGVLFLIVIAIRAWLRKSRDSNLKLFKLFATYWHFLAGLWIVLVCLLFAF